VERIARALGRTQRQIARMLSGQPKMILKQGRKAQLCQGSP
jgi:DNA-binding CsgD family transcriptional regulator